MSFWGGLYISSLFVDENYRNQNYGSLLREKAENLARERGYTFIHLSTMDFLIKQNRFMKN